LAAASEEGGAEGETPPLLSFGFGTGGGARGGTWAEEVGASVGAAVEVDVEGAGEREIDEADASRVGEADIFEEGGCCEAKGLLLLTRRWALAHDSYGDQKVRAEILRRHVGR
jgi:hypothetical protein